MGPSTLTWGAGLLAAVAAAAAPAPPPPAPPATTTAPALERPEPPVAPTTAPAPDATLEPTAPPMPERTPDRGPDRTPERTPERTPDRDRDRSRDHGSDRSRERSPDRPAAAEGQRRAWDDYRLLLDRNIFLRDRRRRTYRAPSSPRPRTRTPVDSDHDIVLTGVGLHDGKIAAFFENTVSEITVRVGIGQIVGKGKVRSITLDSVEYEREGSVSRIEVGYTLRGGRFYREEPEPPPPPTTSPAGPTTSTTQPTTGPAPPTPPVPRPTPPPTAGGQKSSDTSDILKRMRERRERELRR